MSRRQRMISGVMAVLIGCTTVMNSGITVSAAETSKPEIQTISQISEEDQPVIEEEILYDESASDLPTFSEMQERLQEDEFVIADDITIDAGAQFDIATDYRNIAFSEEKVRVEFKSAVNETLESFQTDKAGTYQAVYEVYPVRDENLAYQVNRLVTVKAKEPQSKSQDNKGSGSEEKDMDADEDAEQDLENAETQNLKEDSVQIGRAHV